MIINTDKWEEFTISKLFDIHPTKAYKITNKDLLEDDGKNPVIVNSGFNNGVGGYTNRDCTEEKGIITFTDTAAKSTDSFFYQANDFVGYSHVQGMYALNHEWTENESLFLISVIKAKIANKYDFIEKMTRTDILNLVIKLPITSPDVPDWNYMNEYIETIKNKAKVAIKNCIKTYEYKILNRKIAMPLERLYSHFCYFPLDVEKMRQGAAYLVGEHDFKSFCTVRSQAEETVRTIYSLDVTRDEGDMITIRISGSGFLYNMVRIIAGTLMKVGMGVYPPEHVEEILEARDRQQAGQTALARGLTLVNMEYEKELPRWCHSQNRHWNYHILQSHIKDEKTAFFLVERCRDEEWERLLRRTIHHAFQNGAELVCVADLEKGRLKSGDRYGYYVIEGRDSISVETALLLLDEEEQKEIQKIGSPTSEEWFGAVDGGKQEA